MRRAAGTSRSALVRGSCRMLIARLSPEIIIRPRAQSTPTRNILAPCRLNEREKIVRAWRCIFHFTPSSILFRFVTHTHSLSLSLSLSCVHARERKHRRKMYIHSRAFRQVRARFACCIFFLAAAGRKQRKQSFFAARVFLSVSFFVIKLVAEVGGGGRRNLKMISFRLSASFVWNATALRLFLLRFL